MRYTLAGAYGGAGKRGFTGFRCPASGVNAVAAVFLPGISFVSVCEAVFYWKKEESLFPGVEYQGPAKRMNGARLSPRTALARSEIDDRYMPSESPAQFMQRDQTAGAKTRNDANYALASRTRANR